MVSLQLGNNLQEVRGEFAETGLLLPPCGFCLYLSCLTGSELVCAMGTRGPGYSSDSSWSLESGRTQVSYDGNV